MKLAAKSLKPPASTPSSHHVPPDCPLPLPISSGIDGDPLFFEHISKAAKLTRKDIQFHMRVSKTTTDNWFSGKQRGPLKAARDYVTMCRIENALWVIPTILEYIAGSDFDGAVLTPEERAAIKTLARVMK